MPHAQIKAVPAEKERRQKERSELVASLKDVCVHIVHSHDGARLTMNAIWHGTAKDRKAIIKSFKSYMVKTAKEEHGYMALLAMLDTVDDTKLTGKTVLGELLANEQVLEDVINDERSRKVFTFGLVGRNKAFFHPDVLANLSQGDGNSKKDPDVRKKEVAEFLSEPLCTYVAKNLDKFLGSNSLTLFLGALVQSCPDGSSYGANLLEKLAKKIIQPFTPGDGKNFIESPAVHMFTKKILAKDKFYQLLVCGPCPAYKL